MSNTLDETASLNRRLADGWSALKAFLFPGKAEDDPGFKRVIRERAIRGLYIIASVTALMPSLGRLFHALANFADPRPLPPPVIPMSLFVVAVLALVAARTKWGRLRPRAFALGLGVAVATVFIVANLTGLRVPTEPGFTSQVDLIVVLVVALTTIPARPAQMFVFGWGIAFINFGASTFMAREGLIAAPSMHYYAAFDLIVLLCGVLAGVNYQLIHESYLAHQGQLASQSRLLNTETAVSFSRLSATLSHELNSPIGALSSSVDSLQSLAAKEQGSLVVDRERIYSLRRDLLAGSKEAVAKLSQVVDRIQRYTNLDRAEVTQVQLDKLLQDVAQVVCPGGCPGAGIELHTASLPMITVRPQSISAVFSRLMRNAANVSPDDTLVEVESSQEGEDILVTVRDHGAGLTDEELRELFQPGFKTKGGRVGVSKWGLFTARQVIREHGGEISARRADHGGTRISVRLPIAGPLAAN